MFKKKIQARNSVNCIKLYWCFGVEVKERWILCHILSYYLHQSAA